MKVVYDVETLKNFFSCTCLDADNPSDVRQFVICWSLNIDQRKEMLEYLDSAEIMIGFNNLFYDYAIMELIAEYNGNDINADIYEASNKIINSQREFSRPRKNLLWPQLDLMKINAYDRLGIGLKQISVNLKWHKIQDLPLHHDHFVTQEDVPLILKYNLNDVEISLELYKKLQPQIELRKSLSTLYESDLLNASDSKIANTLLEKFYSSDQETLKELRSLRTKREFIWLKDCIAKGISFKTEKFQSLKFELEGLVLVKESNFGYKKSLEFGNCKYELGIGGLHSDDKPNKFVTDENYIIRDADVASYYPNIILINKIKPEHLDDKFLDILSKITKERITAKRKKDTIKADGLKITINSIFGKLGSETFWLEDAKAMLSVTVSGQLYLLMLIEMLHLAGIMTISANTDGVVCKIPRELESKYLEVCKEWQEKTGFELEYTDYALYVRSDVNNYITKKMDGKTKEKGRYMKEIDLKKAYRHPVVAYSMYEYFVNGKPVLDTLKANKDILDFCLSQKIGKDFEMLYRTEDKEIPLQRTNRFFVSKAGGVLVKRHKEKGTEIGLQANKSVRVLNDYDSDVPFESYDIDYDFYEEEACKYIHEIENSTWNDVLKDEKLSELVLTSSTSSEVDLVMMPPKFRKSKGSYQYDILNGCVWRGVNTIKYITDVVAAGLWELKDKEYSSFIDLLLDTQAYKITSKQMEILIKTNFFEEFGKNKKLLAIAEEFYKGENKYAKNLKEETRNKRLAVLRAIEFSLPDESLPVKEQLDFELEYAGSPQYTDSKFDKRHVYVLDVKSSYSHKLSVYCINNGKKQELKVYKGMFSQKPVKKGDIVYCKKFQKKNAVSMVNGEFVERDQIVFWLTDYEVE